MDHLVDVQALGLASEFLEASHELHEVDLAAAVLVEDVEEPLHLARQAVVEAQLERRVAELVARDAAVVVHVEALEEVDDARRLRRERVAQRLHRVVGLLRQVGQAGDHALAEGALPRLGGVDDELGKIQVPAERKKGG